MIENNFILASEWIKNSNLTTLFSGAGISVESGIPPFRGKNGIWEKYDTKYLDIEFFKKYPKESWKTIKEIFYDFTLSVNPNRAHYFFSRLQNSNMLDTIITQNIDNLHQKSGSFNVIELHGTTVKTICISCGIKYDFRESLLNNLPPVCENCGGYLKPDFVFFGEPLPENSFSEAIKLSKQSELQIIIGTSGEVFPASKIPFISKDSGSKIIEINPERSNYTENISNIFLRGNATDICLELEKLIFGSASNYEKK